MKKKDQIQVLQSTLKEVQDINAECADQVFALCSLVADGLIHRGNHAEARAIMGLGELISANHILLSNTVDDVSDL